jgi:hypothetical protein
MSTTSTAKRAARSEIASVRNMYFVDCGMRLAQGKPQIAFEEFTSALRATGLKIQCGRLPGDTDPRLQLIIRRKRKQSPRRPTQSRA